MPGFTTHSDHSLCTLQTAELALAFSLEHGGLRMLQRLGGPNVLGYGADTPAIDIHLGQRGWLAEQIFVRYLRHQVVEHAGAVELAITIGIGPLLVQDCYRITGTLITRSVLIKNVGEDTVDLHGVRLLLLWARVGALESCRFDAPGNRVRPHVPLSVAAAQRRDMPPRSLFGPELREGFALERAPTQGPGVMSLHDPAIDEALVCWYYSALAPALPYVNGNDTALTLAHELRTENWLRSEQQIELGRQYWLLLHEPWPAVLAALRRTWPLAGFRSLDQAAAWLPDMALYEAHPARFGGFSGLAAALPELRALGVNTLCLLPIWEFANHKQHLWDGNWQSSGNPYAIRDFTQIDPTLGDAGNLRELVAAAHDHQLRVLIDLPLEGCAADSPLVQQHPSWFCRDESGEIAAVPQQPGLLAFDWDQAGLQDAMLGWAEQQARDYDLDGFRAIAPREHTPNWGGALPEPACELGAGLLQFLGRLQHAIKAIKHDAVLLGTLAGPAFDAAHDALVDELPHHMFVHLALSRISPAELGEWLEQYDQVLPRSAARICFTESHQTRIINPLADGLRGSRISRMLMAGIVICGFVPLICAGQEDEDGHFIRRLLYARAMYPALRAGRVAYNSLPCSEAHVFAVLREYAGDQLIGLLNVSPHKHTFTISLPVDRFELCEGDYELLDLFTQRVWVEENRQEWRRDELLSLRLTLDPFAAYCLLLRAVVPGRLPDLPPDSALIAEAPAAHVALLADSALGASPSASAAAPRQSRRKRASEHA